MTSSPSASGAIRVQVDAGALLVLALVLAMLATGYFPAQVPSLGGPASWALSVVAATGFALTVVLHEMAHVLVARRLGVPGNRITLDLRGGRAELSTRAPSPRAEAVIAVAGPAANVLLAAGCVALGRWTLSSATAAQVLLGLVATLNLALAVINLLPLLPLDGGRVLRAFLWSRTGSYDRGTQLAWRCTRIGLTILALAGAVAAVTGRYRIAATLVLGALYLAWRAHIVTRNS